MNQDKLSTAVETFMTLMLNFRTLVTLGNFTPFRARVDLRTLFSLVIFKRAHCIQI